VITELYAVSETVSTTEWSLTTDSAGPDVDTNDGVYQLWLDLSALVKGDKFMVRCYEKVQSGGTQRVVAEWFFANAQTPPNWVSPSLILMHGWDFTIIRTAGTDRAITASVRQVA
jgi:hypothetical protein